MLSSRKLRIGIVCPYGWDTPGGVQAHVGDLSDYLISQGHHVSVLAPAIDENSLPPYVVSAGKPIAIPYNGAVARVLFGPIAFSRVRQWISQGEFDLLHLHEPAIPSLSLLACWAAEGPMVGTFHASSKRQRAIFAVGPILEPVIEKLAVRIAVSEAARETLTQHLETDAIVIPNGIFCEKFRAGIPQSKWQGNTLGFMGRFEEPRKGLEVLLDALPAIVKSIPDVRVLVAGPGEIEDFRAKINPHMRNRVTFLGRLSEEDKANFLNSVSVYVAPNTGGESFGIILAEALAAGAPVVASNIPAFASLLGQGRYGSLFTSEDPAALATSIINILKNNESRKAIVELGREHSQVFDWGTVAQQIFSVYEMAMVGSDGVRLTSETRSWSRFLNREGANE